MNFLEGFTAKKPLVWLFLALITILAYGPVLRGDYVFDDDIFIVNNQYVHDLNHVKQIYTHSTTDGAGVGDGNFYRPNQSLCHAIIYTLVGSGPAAQHIFSVLVHALNACLLFSFLVLLGFTGIPALAGALIFAIHPIQTEAVAYISGLSDPLSMMFILITSICFLLYQKESQIYWAIFSIISLVLALFSKESSAMTFGVLILLALYLNTSKKKFSNGTKYYLGIAFILCIGYLYLKFTTFNFTGNIALTSADNEYTQSIWVRFVTFCTIFPKYLGMLIFPIDQYIEKPYLAYVSLEALGLGGLMLLGALGYIFYTSYKSTKVWMLSIGIFLLFLLPVSGIIPTNAIYLEHWLYLPFLGVAIAIAQGVKSVKNVKYKPMVLGLIAVLSVAYISKTAFRNYQWADAIRFYKNEIHYNKKSARIYNNLAMVLNSKKEYQSAANYYMQAISVYDVYPQTHHNLALTYIALNQVSNAIVEEYKALQMNPGFIYSLKELYDIYTTLKDTKRAAAFEGYIQQVQQGQQPSWNEIKENLHADKP